MYRERGAVQESGQRIDRTEPRDLLHLLFAGGDVLLDSDEVADAALRRPYGSDRYLCGVSGAVLLPVLDLASPNNAGEGRLPEIAEENRPATAILQHTRIASHQLVEGVARHCDQGRISPFDDAVAIGDQDAGSGGLERSAEQAQWRLADLVLQLFSVDEQRGSVRFDGW
ncbi:MAG: hypothetical protein K8J08_17120 [Thermoanaerobaculia bacterium]|nr:hypothetical protein [Thermoanaerobaculia bacterium]